MKKILNTVLIGLGNIGYKYDVKSKNIQHTLKLSKIIKIII